MEVWADLQSYPGYSVSNIGRIRNDKRDKVLSIVRTESGHGFVGLTYNGSQVKRAVSKLVAEAFVPNSRPRQFTTPIHLDGDVRNCYADNLLWRPRWFAQKFTTQFRLDLPHTHAVRELETRQVFDDLWPPVMTYGLLYMEIISAIHNRTWVFPTQQFFEWVI